ncbi:MAG: phosphatase PAP2 family protein [Elusimicrobia bacterium]|nr:phosphatase PAP2 family protein [Elusimicrobiota bacterium]
MKFALALLAILSPALRAAEVPRYAWDESWPKFRASEYAVTGAALAGAAANFYLVPAPQSPVWRGPILFDKPARNALLIGSAAGRDRAKSLSDLLSYPLIGYAMLDGPITAGWAGGNKDTAIQLALINAETFAVVEVLNLTVSNVLPRSRPEGAVCDPNTKYDPACVKSFWSGHAANVFAAASLVCAEHGALGLYGGGKADTIACAGALVVASAVGVSRITSNNHHASDVFVGAAVGAAAGYLMPKLLHFRPKKDHHLGYLMPSVGPQGGGLTYVKTW